MALDPSHPESRASDADREAAADRLRVAALAIAGTALGYIGLATLAVALVAVLLGA